MKILSFTLLAATVLLTSCMSTIPQTPETPAQQLVSAAKDGDKVRVQKLLDAGLVPGDGGGDILSDGLGVAEYYRHMDIYQLLLKRCREAFVYGQNCAGAPADAAGKGDTLSMSAFMARGLDVNAEVGNSTMLGYAAGAGNVASAKFLIEHGADVDRAISSFEAGKVRLAALGNASAHIAKQDASIALLERLRPGGKTPTASPAGGGISRAEMEQMLKSAAAAAAASKMPSAPAVPAEIKSDVDAPMYKVAANPDAFAVVIGVEKYNSLPDARFAERDAKAMNAHLLAMGYPQRNIVLLTGHQATRTGLVKNLEAWLPNQITERSTVLFYFSGHGAPDAKTSAAYLVPTDGDPQYLEETAYPIKRLYEKLGALKAKRVLVALDSCFSGAGGRSVIASGTRPLVAKLMLAPTEAKVVSLSASSSEEITGALEDQGHGLFTYHLLKALSETAGRGSVSELHAALTPRVQDEARRQNRSQTPQMFGASVDGGLR